MAVLLDPEEIEKLEEIQVRVDRLVEIIFNDCIDNGNSLPPSPDGRFDTNFGAFYDRASPDNLFSPSYEYQSEGFPIRAATDFELLRDWSLELNEAANLNPDFYFDLPTGLGALGSFLVETSLLSSLAQEWIDDHTTPSLSSGSIDLDEIDSDAAEPVVGGLPSDPPDYEGAAAGSIAAPAVDCRDPEVDEEIEQCPPPCQGDPRASSPNWTRLTDKEPFINSKTCEYSITLRTEYDAAPISDLYSDPDYLREGVIKLLDFYGKKQEPYNRTLQDGSEGELVDPIEVCMSAGTIKDTFVSTRPYVKMKALVVVPYDVFNSIEELEQPEELPERKDQPAYTIIKGDDFFLMLRQVARAMDIMAVRQAAWFFNEGGQLSEPTFNPKEEADRIRLFSKTLRDLCLENDFLIERRGVSRISFGKRIVEEIEIGFNENMGVDYVKALERSCEKPVLFTKGMSSFKSSEPQTLPRTMYFIHKIAEMQNDFTSSDSILFADFISKYVAFPPVEIVTDAAGLYSSQPIWCPPVSEDGQNDNFNFGDEMRELSKSIMDEILSLPDAFVDRFANDLCATLEGKRKADVKLNDLDDLALRAADTALREFFAGDRFLEQIPELLDRISSGDPEELWSEILDQLGLCGLLSLISAAMECLLAGLELDDALSTMLNAVIGGMATPVFEVFMLALPPEAKEQIRLNLVTSESLGAFKDLPAPWDADYREGSYSGQGTKFSITNTSAPTGYQGEQVTEEMEITLEDGTTAMAEVIVVDSELEPAWKAQKEVTYSGVPTTVGNTTGVVINEAAIGQFYGSTGTIGTAADKIGDQILKAYKDSLLDLIDNNLIDLDMLKEQLTKIPGAQLFADIFQELDCPPFPLFSPPLGNILTTLELNLCPAHFAITLPRLSIDVSIGDIFKLILDIAKELIKELVVRLIILILKKILEIIFEALCALLGLVGGALVNAITGGNELKNALGGALCDDATEEDINEAMRQMLEATGAANCSGLEEAPTAEDAAAFTEVAASVLTNQEMLDLLDGTATTQVKQLLSDAVGSQVPALSCMGPSDVGNLFNSLGKLINPELIQKALLIDNLDTPICDNICASPEQLRSFNDIRCSIMQQKGLSPEECESQLASLRDRAKEDLADLANILNGGPFHNFPDIVGSDPNCPDDGQPRDPLAPGGFIIPEVPKALNDAANQATRRLFDTIAEQHIDDLVGRRGFLDMVLCDSNGRGLKSHQAIVSGPFGQNLTEDLTVFQNYTDNWIDETGVNTSIEVGTNSDNGRGEAGSWGRLVSGDIGTGGFPFTVASLLQRYFVCYNQVTDNFENIVKIKADVYEGPNNSMRGQVISGDSKGVPWEDSEFDLYYRDYAVSDDESYAMHMNMQTADQELNELGLPTGRWSRRDTTVTTIYENIENNGEEEILSLRVTSDISQEAQDVIDSLGLEETTALPKAIFSNLIIQKLGEYGTLGTTSLLKDTLERQHEYLVDVYTRKFALLMASNKDRKRHPAPNSFQFGYDTSQVEKTVYLGGKELDLNFFNNNTEYYKNLDGTQATYGEAIDEETGPFIQQIIFDRFGGSFKNPPFYILEPEGFGWLGMTNRLVPPVDACDPLDGSEPREPICKFDDLKDKYTDLLNKYKDDKRLFVKPGSDCGGPQIFNAVFSKGAAAGVDSMIMTMIRIYVVEAMLRGTAIFSVFGKDCYDEILSSYIIKYMEDELPTIGIWGLPSRKFYYFFMEQIVQMYGRQVDLGLIEPSEIEREALKNLNRYQLDNPINKKIKAAYNSELFDLIEQRLENEKLTGEPGIRTLLSHFVLEEIRSTFDQFGSNVYPDGAPIQNTHSIFFNSDAFIRGSTSVGIPDVWNGEEGSDSNVYDAEYTGPVGPSLALQTGDTAYQGVGHHPFRLEKFIRFSELPDSLVLSREDKLKGVVGLDAFKEWASTQTSLLDTELSELFLNVSYGIRLTFASAPSVKENTEWGGGSDIPINFNNGFQEAISPFEYNVTEKVGRIPITKDPYTYREEPTSNFFYIVPIVGEELQLDMGQTLQDMIDGIDDFAEQNEECILDGIANSGEYQAMFGVSIPFKKMLSWLAIYTINNFLPSVGWVRDGWVKDGGKWISGAGGFRSWDQRSFEKSKRETKRSFMRFYHSSDPTYEDDESKQRKKEITRRQKPNLGRDPGWRWFRWKRKIDKPTDKNEKLCP